MQDPVTRKSVKYNLGFFLPHDKPNALSEWCGTIDTKQRIKYNILHAPIAEK